MKRIFVLVLVTGLFITPAFAQLQIERTDQEQAYTAKEQQSAPRLQIFPPMGLTGKDWAAPPGLRRIDPPCFLKTTMPYYQQNAALMKAIAKLEMNKYILLKTADLGMVTTVYLSASESMMTVRIGNTERPVPLASIREMWVRGRATKQGAKYGVVYGFIGGALIGGLYGNALWESGYSRVKYITGGALGVGVLAGGGGLMLGAIIGSVTKTWHKIYG
ncbi:hypothetical protein ACFL6L_02065 [candidate division KSB1 bacterium]